MRIKPESCKGCALADIGLGFMEPDGDGTSGLALVGDQMDRGSGRPLAGRSGHLLNTALELAGINRGTLSVLQSVWCWPGKSAVAPKTAFDYCTKTNLLPALAQAAPRAIVTLGPKATENLTGLTDDMEGIRGYPIWSNRFKAWIIPAYHPEFIQRGNYNLEPLLVHDLQKAAGIATAGYQPRWGNYLIDPSPDSCWAWARRAALAPVLAFDGEWDRHSKRLYRISFSTDAFSGISFPTKSEYWPIIRFLLESEQEKCVWNRPADVPVLAAHGVIVGGLVHDSMVAWHILHTDLPKGLDVVATIVCPEQPRWAHLSSSQPGLYSAVDSDILLRIHLHVMRAFEANPERGRVYLEHVVALDRRLAKMSARGVPIDPAKREAAARALTTEIGRMTKEMGQAIPVEIRPGTPKLGYVREPKVITDQMVKRTFEIDGAPVERYVKLAPLKISWQLILKYQQFMGHPWAYERVPGRKPKPTTNNAAMLRALFKYQDDPIYQRIQKLRRLGIYRGVVGRWEKDKLVGGIPVGPDGRIHTTFSHNPSTLRLASENPNAQNLPRPEDEWSSLVRGMFVTPPGRLFMERDFGGIEARLTGYFSGSRAMYYLSGLDIHTWNTAHWMAEQKQITAADLPSLDWTEKDLTDYLHRHKKRWPEQRQGIKVQTHAMNYLAKPKEIQEILLNELEWVVDIADIKKFYGFYRELFPELPAFHRNLVAAVENIEEVEIQGLRTGYHWIQNPFGYLHYFFHCAEWEKVGGAWQWGLGPSATDLAAFPGQSTAAAIGKAALLRFERDYPDLVEDVSLFIHDSFFGEWPESLADRVQTAMAAVMEAPILEMPLPPEWQMGDFVTISSEGKQGADWGHMVPSRV